MTLNKLAVSPFLALVLVSSLQAGVVDTFTATSQLNQTAPTFSATTPGLGLHTITTGAVPSPAPVDPTAEVTHASNNSVVTVLTDSTAALGDQTNTFRWTVTTTAFMDTFRLEFFNNPINVGDPFPVVGVTDNGAAGFQRKAIGATFIEWESENTGGFGVAPGTYSFDFSLAIADDTSANPRPPGQFNIVMSVANPEPTTLVLGGVALSLMGGGVGWRVRRRKKKKDADSSEESVANK